MTKAFTVVTYINAMLFSRRIGLTIYGHLQTVYVVFFAMCDPFQPPKQVILVTLASFYRHLKQPVLV